MLAYYHTHFSGFVPCKILAQHVATAPAMLRIKFTASRGAYKRGECLWVFLGDVVRRPLRVSRQHTGRLYSTTHTPDEVAHLPTI